MNRKKLLPILGFAAVLAGLAVLFVLNKTNEKVDDVAQMETKKIYSTAEAFEQPSDFFDASIDKPMSIEGPIQSITKDGDNLTLVLGEDEMNTIICQIDSRHLTSFTNLTEGQMVQLKGVISGFDADDMLGSTIQLKNCAPQN